MHKKLLIKELNRAFNMNFSPEKLFIGHCDLSDRLKYILTLPLKDRKQYCNILYVMTVILYRIYKGGNFIQTPFWDVEIISALESAAEIGSKHAWYDLAQFYKLNSNYSNHTIYALEKAVKFGFIIAVKDLENLYEEHKKNNNHICCNQIRVILNKYYTNLDKSSVV